MQYTLKQKTILALWLLLLGLLPLSVEVTADGIDNVPKLNVNAAMRLSAEERLHLLEKAETVSQKIATEGVFNQLNGALLVAEKGVILYAGANGYANYRTKEPIQLESVFQLASVSKTFTAVAIMQLFESNKLQFDDLVSYHLPDFPYKNITIKMLLTHRSGLGNYMHLAPKYGQTKLPFTNNDLHQLFVKHKPKLNFPSNTKFEYSNTGYAYLALLVEKISGKSFENYLNDHLFAPLNMHSTFVFNANMPPKRIDAVKGHKTHKWLLQDETNYVLNGITGDKGVYSNINDLFLFDQALHHGDLLLPSTKKLAFEPGSPELKYANSNYGFGFRLRNENGKKVIYHNGWWGGFKAAFRHYIDEDITLIALTNNDKKFPTPWQCEQQIVFAGDNLLPDNDLNTETE